MKLKQLIQQIRSHNYTGNILFSLMLWSGIYLIDFGIHLVNNRYPFNIGEMDWKTPLWLLIFTTALSFTRRGVKTFFVISIIVVTLIQVMHFQYLGSYIQPISFHLAVTHPGEVSESLLADFWQMATPAGVVVLIGIFLLWFTRRIGNRGFSSKYAVILLLFLFMGHSYRTYGLLQGKNGKLYHWQAKKVMPMPNHPAVVNIFRSLQYYFIGIIPKKILGDIDYFPQLPEPKVKIKHPDINIVVIIGESLRAKQLSMLGYKGGETTPLLRKIDTLQYQTIYAGGIMTKSAVAAIINRLKHPGVSAQIASQSNNLFRLAKENGFTTHFVSGQSNGGTVILQNLIGKNNVDNFMTRTDFPETYPEFDIALNHYLQEVDFSKNNFIAFQMLGSHLPYQKCYPESFKHFKDPYDNSVLYTDYVVSEMIKTVRQKSKKPTYIIFTSDHGQMINNEEGLKGHGWFKDAVFRVPLMILTHNVADQTVIDDSFPHIKSHFDMSTLIIQLLGYDQQVDRSVEKMIYINGSDIDGLAGHQKIMMRGNRTESSETVR